MSDLDARVARLEERLSWHQRHVVEQDKAMLEMADEIARLRLELKAQRERPGAGGGAFGGGNDEPVDERPPHY